VHSAYSAGTVPATHVRKFDVDSDARCLTPTELADLKQPAGQYVVIGSGKTGADVCLWLLDRGVAPDRICWVMPRDAWWIDRRSFQPGPEFFLIRLQLALSENEAVCAAENLPHLFRLLGDAGCLLQLDPDVTPTAYKCGTVTLAELEMLRKITNVVRLGHVERVSAGKTMLQNGVYNTADDMICIDCTATGISKVPSIPVFQTDQIFMQGVRTCQPTFSAAFIAHLEASYADDAQKNALSTPVPYPTTDTDWVHQKLISLQNQFAWLQHKDLRDWLKACRLDALTSGQQTPDEKQEFAPMAERFKESLLPTMVKLKTLSSMARTASS